jgi:replicative DNA helicase
MDEQPSKEKEEFDRDQFYLNYDGEDKVVNFKDVVTELRAKEGDSKKGRVYSNLPSLDSLLDGYRPGQLIVLSAPTGQGKTAFLQSLTYTFVDNKIPCLWFSYEVSVLEMAERFGTVIPNFQIPKTMKESSMEWLKDRCHDGMVNFGTKVIFIDHLHYLLDMKTLAMAKNVSLAIGMLMRDIKRFAVETGTIVFLVSHLAKTKLDDMPSISDLRDSSFVGQESDVVMIMWRDKVKDATSPTGSRFTDEATLLVEKNRVNGKLGGIKMVFKNGRFMEPGDAEGFPSLHDDEKSDEIDPTEIPF